MSMMRISPSSNNPKYAAELVAERDHRGPDAREQGLRATLAAQRLEPVAEDPHPVGQLADITLVRQRAQQVVARGERKAGLAGELFGRRAVGMRRHRLDQM